MPRAVLITQCLQRDFVDPIGRYEPLPNQLHVGHAEAVRLLGEDPAAGPLAQLLDFITSSGGDDLEVVHIRDWHDAADPAQAEHLTTFGPHCLRGTDGARLVLNLDDSVANSNVHVVDSLTLNDFEGTELAALLERTRADAGGAIRVGVIGVWTEAKVTFLLYELKTRMRIDDLATCSALTASASRAQHFNALGQLERILGVSVFDSIGEFAEWLRPGTPLEISASRGGAVPHLHSGEAEVDSPGEAPTAIISHLFRESSDVWLTSLSGGFSGAAVYQTTSQDALGHRQAPSVVKIGPNRLIAQERVAFERVEEVLGNNAPMVRGFVDLGEYAGIRFSYAAMGQGQVRTLKALVEDGAPVDRIATIVRTTFDEILAPLYAAARYERMPIFREYDFSSRWAARVSERARSVLAETGGSLKDLTVRLPDGTSVPSIVPFYEQFLDSGVLPENDFHYVSFVHGDLNASNILVDGRDNVWVIDFLHTAPGHVLKDLAKLENDLLYVLTPLNSESELTEAIALTRTLLAVEDLAAPLGDLQSGVSSPQFTRAWQLLVLLRDIGGTLCREDRSPLQLQVALLRYAAHTLGFDESSPLQRCWALAAAGLLADRIETTLRSDRQLRVDWLDPAHTAPGRLGITILPGRRDRGRDLADDLAALRRQGVTRLVCLSPDDELARVGVAGLLAQARAERLEVLQVAVPDQGVPGLAEARKLCDWCRQGTAAGESVVITCLGGLGRSGTIAACYLVVHGLDASAAISEVRRRRDPRAVETRSQERFVVTFAAEA